MHAAIPLFDTSRVYGFRSVLPARECVLSNYSEFHEIS